ncbi:hypothetical protein A3A68_01280 [Candidatus Saccharibacteria bacterium RIFCSPLOWO2_01_FULL_48_13]|nr:MAG: hypothetical protein A2884_00750 [Candidatus Saccharibacteria bacterium RIFCSPHIGHO2_01_FULL_48_12]OGL37233.1 MAG: hypothetical protein A3A68_01280 [Candidatus Saccharibacteria bacterium RIFCSPLOWO2_01_FULL_48_13]
MESWNVIAYLDAGTGSIIIQSVVGAVAGVAVFGRRMFGNLIHKAKSITSRSATTQTTDES